MKSAIARGPASPADNGKRIQLARWSHRAGVLPLLQGLRRIWRPDLRILAYHRILDIADADAFKFDLEVVSASTRQFREQLELVKRRFRPVTFGDLIAALDGGPVLPADAILITFDDGYDDNYRVAFPILRELGMSAMFFVSTGHIDTGLPYAYDWLVYMVCATRASRLTVAELGMDVALPTDLIERRRIAEVLLERVKRSDDAQQNAVITRLQQEWNMPRVPHPDCHPMNWDQLREMQAAGMEIGSHGVHHRMLAKLPQDELVREIAESKVSLDGHLGRPAEVISYPVGGFDAYDERVMTIAREAGYRAACTYVVGTNRLNADSRYALKRLAVEREMDAAWFSAMTTLPEVFGYSSSHHDK
jgi:peptidoglycan/xylan/chitin deacetylase (PgdA/CDA1 family)